MTATLIIVNDTVRATGRHWLSIAPVGTVVKFLPPKRTIPQNSRMWAMLTDVSKQSTLRGKQLTPERWKLVFMQALGCEIEFEEGLEAGQYFPIGHSSKRLSKEKMTALMDFIECYGAENDVSFTGMIASPL